MRTLVEPKVGDVVADKYRLDRVIGVGGMGTVYAAHHAVLDQTVAVKILAKEFARSTEISSRFLHETRAAAKLKSEHVARVMDAGTAESGLPFLVMEHLEGQDLGQLLRDTAARPSTDEIAHYAIQALEGLAHAHRAGIVHRDIKPGNLFLASRPGMPPTMKVLDFGISKGLSVGEGEARAITQSHQIVGSPGYMSPEQIRDASTVDARTDVWSLGVVMYELLTGKAPFPGQGTLEIFSAVLERTPPTPRSLRANVPEELSAIVMRCLERDRDARFRDVSELAHALEPYAPAQAAPLVARIDQILHDTVPTIVAPSSSPSSSKRAPTDDEAIEHPAGVPRSGNWIVVLVFAAIVAAGFYYVSKQPRPTTPTKKSTTSAATTSASTHPSSAPSPRPSAQTSSVKPKTTSSVPKSKPK